MGKRFYRGLTGIVAAGAVAVGSYFGVSAGMDAHSEWMEQKIQERIRQYEAKDKRRTDERLQASGKRADKKFKTHEKRIRGMLEKAITEGDVLAHKEGLTYKRWLEKELDKYQKNIPQDQLNEAFESIYLVLCENTYESKEEKGKTATLTPQGSGILLKGGYILTAWHVIDTPQRADIPIKVESALFNHFRIHDSELKKQRYFLAKGSKEKSTDKKRLEEILRGDKKLDYALLKVKDSTDLSFYSQGLNLPGKIDIGMRNIALGHRYGLEKRFRIGAISQQNSEHGKDYLTSEINVEEGDSGGPLFVLEDGEMKLASINISVRRDNSSYLTSLSHSLKIKSIIADMKKKLKSGKLDKEKAAQVKEFLRLNEK